MRAFLMMILCVISWRACCTPVKDFGTHGHTWPIAEKSLLEVIQERLRAVDKRGRLKELQQKFVERVKKTIGSPKPCRTIKRTHTPREYFFDPTYTQKEEIKDHEGRIVVQAGTSVNPLDYVSWGEDLILIDGRDPEQVGWALPKSGKVVLVEGNPLDLSAQHKRWFYFDQGGIIARKFGIEQVPAVISQAGKHLKIKEIKI